MRVGYFAEKSSALQLSLLASRQVNLTNIRSVFTCFKEIKLLLSNVKRIPLGIEASKIRAGRNIVSTIVPKYYIL